MYKILQGYSQHDEKYMFRCTWVIAKKSYNTKESRSAKVHLSSTTSLIECSAKKNNMVRRGLCLI